MCVRARCGQLLGVPSLACTREVCQAAAFDVKALACSPTPTQAAVRDTLWAAALLYLVRLAGIWLGCNGGAILGAAPEAIGGKVWMGMVTQVGLDGAM